MTFKEECISLLPCDSLVRYLVTLIAGSLHLCTVLQGVQSFLPLQNCSMCQNQEKQSPELATA